MKILMKWTLKDYHNLITTGILNGRRLEFIKGDIIEMSPEGPLHVAITEETVEYLRKKLQGLALVREVHPITLSNSEPEPDIAIVKLPRKKYKNHHPYPEDIFWLIEISQSTLNYDLLEKKRLYAEANIKEYWVIDVNKKEVHLFLHPQGEDYQFHSVITKGNIIPLDFSDIQISVEKLWLD